MLFRPSFRIGLVFLGFGLLQAPAEGQTTTRVSVDSAGVQANLGGQSSGISADGRFVTFESAAANFDHDDSNRVPDVFLRDRGAPNLARTGDCPGAVTLTISNATGGGNVAIACGAAGRRVRRAAPCTGLLLEVSPPLTSLIRAASASGTVVLRVSAPAGACGRSVQAVDVTSCAASNVIVL